MKKIERDVSNYWDLRMCEYGDWFQKYLIQPSIAETLKKFNTMKILDAGCGTGHLSRWLYSQGACVIGIDISNEMILIAKKYSDNIHYIVGDITNIDLNDEFDAIILNNTIQDIPNFSLAISNCKKMLSKSGKLVIIIRHPCFYSTNPELGWELVLEDSTIIHSGIGLTNIEENYRNFRAKYYLMDNYYSKANHIRSWGERKTVFYVRTISEYFKAINEAGLIVTELLEPCPIDVARNDNPNLFDILKRIPGFIIFVAEFGRFVE
jgi:SAM-dependent methyltransferase